MTLHLLQKNNQICLSYEFGCYKSRPVQVSDRCVILNFKVWKNNSTPTYHTPSHIECCVAFTKQLNNQQWQGTTCVIAYHFRQYCVSEVKMKGKNNTTEEQQQSEKKITGILYLSEFMYYTTGFLSYFSLIWISLFRLWNINQVKGVGLNLDEWRGDHSWLNRGVFMEKCSDVLYVPDHPFSYTEKKCI